MNTYKCAMCQQIYEKGWTDEEAKAELKENFSRDDTDNCELVCDDCFKNIEFNAIKSYADLRAKARKDMADVYRKMRKDNPVMARLYFKVNKATEKAIIDTILYGIVYD